MTCCSNVAMQQCSIQPRNQKFVKYCISYGHNLGKNISRNLDSKYNQNFLIVLNIPHVCTQNCFEKSNSKSSWSKW